MLERFEDRSHSLDALSSLFGHGEDVGGMSVLGSIHELSPTVGGRAASSL